MVINDAHCHFFSPLFFAALARQKGFPDVTAGAQALGVLGWEDPRSNEGLADRWVDALDAHGVHRAALIASIQPVPTYSSTRRAATGGSVIRAGSR